jgi:hypothetical protein
MSTMRGTSSVASQRHQNRNGFEEGLLKSKFFLVHPSVRYFSSTSGASHCVPSGPNHPSRAASLRTNQQPRFVFYRAGTA